MWRKADRPKKIVHHPSHLVGGNTQAPMAHQQQVVETSRSVENLPGLVGSHHAPESFTRDESKEQIHGHEEEEELEREDEDIPVNVESDEIRGESAEGAAQVEAEPDKTEDKDSDKGIKV